MAEISFEEAVGGGPAKVSSSSLPSRAFQPTAISFEEAMGIPPLKSPVPGFKEPSPLGFALEGLKAMGGETAALADLVLALPGFLTGVGAQLGGTVQAAARGVPLIADPRQLNSLTAYGVGRAAGEEFGGTAMQATSRINPLRKLMEFVGAEDAIEQSATTKGLEKLTSLLDRAGRWAENATGGRVARDAVPMFAETLLASTIGLGAKRPGPIPEHVQKAMRKQQEKMRAEAEAELAAEPTPLEQAAQTPVHQQINEMLGIRPPTEQARVTRQRRLDAQAAFAERGKPRELLPEEQSALDVAEARGTRTYETAGEQLFTAEERLAREESYRGSLPREEAAAYEVGSYRPPKRIDQAEVLRVLKKPGFERTAGDLVVLRAARQEGKAMPEALMLLGAAGIGATAGGLLDDDALRGAVLGGAAAAAPLAMMSGLRAGGVPRAFREAGAVKGPGGMWHPEAVERLTAPLERRLRANLPADQGHILGAWAESKVRNYLNRYAGTERDPLKNVEIPYGEGMKRWEEVTDKIVRPHVTSDVVRQQFGARPGERIWEMAVDRSRTTIANGGYRDARVSEEAIKSYLSHVGDYLRQNVKPADLPRYDLVRAVKETAANDARVAKEMEKASAASTKDLPVHKAYPDGFKWVELKLPEKLTPEQGKQVRRADGKDMYEALEPEAQAEVRETLGRNPTREQM